MAEKNKKGQEILEEAMSLYLSELADSVSCSEEEFEPSERHLARMKRLCRNAKKPRFSKGLSPLGYAAAAALVLLTVSGGFFRLLKPEPYTETGPYLEIRYSDGRTVVLPLEEGQMDSLSPERVYHTKEDAFPQGYSIVRDDGSSYEFYYGLYND